MTASTKSGFRAKLVEELKKTGLIFAYLALFFGSFTVYRRMVLAEYDIGYFNYGYSLIEAAVLAKVIVVGSMLGLGERFRDRPLIVPTLYKAACFAVFLLVFSVIEHVVGAWLHGKSTDAGWLDILDQGKWEILTRVLVKSIALLPLFAVWETARVVGERRLYELFFRERPAGERSRPH